MVHAVESNFSDKILTNEYPEFIMVDGNNATYYGNARK